MRPLELWFELASTYSHIAVQRVEAVARDAGVTIAWRPFLLGPVFRQQGWTDSPFNLYPAKGAYMWRDVERECRKYGVPFRRPSQFPRGSVLAARLALIGEAEPWIGALVRRLYLANFHDDLDIADPAVVRGLIPAAAGDLDALIARAGSPEVKQLLRDRTDEAIARGIFGAPSFFAGGELYWGNDRLADAIAACAD